MPAPDTVKVRWLAVDHLGDGDLVRLRACLDDAERTRADRFAFERDRVAYTAAHALLRSVLSSDALDAGLAPADWRFVPGPHGRPEIVGEQNRPGLRFNISHTTGFVAVALAAGHEVGVDVEARVRRGLTMEIADRYFAPAEIAHLDGLVPADRREAFMAFWTLKEAYIKAIGKGLACPLDAFAFTLDPLSIAFSDRLDDRPERWLFRRLSPVPDYLLALAVRHPEPASLTVDAAPAGPDLLA